VLRPVLMQSIDITCYAAAKSFYQTPPVPGSGRPLAVLENL
jgi:hypothetical protein